jgi:hypothetical protein
MMNVVMPFIVIVYLFGYSRRMQVMFVLDGMVVTMMEKMGNAVAANYVHAVVVNLCRTRY